MKSIIVLTSCLFSMTLCYTAVVAEPQASLYERLSACGCGGGGGGQQQELPPDTRNK